MSCGGRGERAWPALLGAHVAQGADEVSGRRHAGFTPDTGQAEVGDPQVAATIDQQVGRLHVAVHNAALVGVFERLGRLQ